MSRSFCIRPVSAGDILPISLLQALEKEYQFPILLSSISAEYLKALKNMEVGGASDLLEKKFAGEFDFELFIEW